MTNKADVKRARVAGMYDAMAVYKFCREHGQTEAQSLDSLERYIISNEWKI